MANVVPAYALKPIKDFLSYWEDCERLLFLSTRGISILKNMPQVVQAIAIADGDADAASKEHAHSLQQAKKLAAFADHEVQAGFPLLHAHMLVGVWGAMEAAIGDMLVGILINEPELLSGEAFAKVRITLAEFQTLEKEDRMRLLLEETARLQGSGTKQGVDKFEIMLDRFHLSGSFEEEVKKTLWEISHVRNVIIHRGSVADRRLLTNCPWINFKIGDRVVITHDALYRYVRAMCTYATDLIERLCFRYQVVMSPATDSATPQVSSEIPQAAATPPSAE